MEEKKIKMVVFDWAGTTVDYGSSAPAEVFAEIFEEAGIHLTREEINGPMGMEKKAHIRALLSLEEAGRQWEACWQRPWNEEDVQALYDDVRTRYQQAQEQDPTLAEFIQRISGELTEESAESQETTETTETEETEEPAEETADTAEAGETAESAETAEETGEGTVLNRQTRVAESVNMRAEASTDSERLALIYQGETVTQIQAYDNGWSQIEYNGMTGYILTEYLE